jgi:hypothetical protein
MRMAKAEGGKKYNVVRRNFFGDEPKLSAAGLTKEDADKYAAEMTVAERASFEVVSQD